VHTLHEWHLACHAGPHQEFARREFRRKKWRAHPSAPMPWSEQVRHEIVVKLRSLLLLHLAPTCGQRVRVDDRTGRQRRTMVDGLECGGIAAMTKEEPSLKGQTTRERLALNLCHRIARVRNEIAHLRPPRMEEIQTLMSALDDHRREIEDSKGNSPVRLPDSPLGHGRHGG
jgi:hypothetical protein